MQLGVRGEVAFGGSQEAFPLEAPRATFNAMAVDFLPLESFEVVSWQALGGAICISRPRIFFGVDCLHIRD
jgi:hypothetical protein